MRQLPGRGALLKTGGQKGRQSAVLTAGYYRIKPTLFCVIPDMPITKIDAYKLGVEAMGGTYSLLQIFTVLAEKGIRLTPDVMVAGGGGAGASEGMIAMLLRDTLKGGTEKHSS